MCLALPAQVLEVNGDTATVDVNGVNMPCSLAFLDGVEVDDFVIVHVGFALSRIDRQEAERQLALMEAHPALFEEVPA